MSLFSFRSTALIGASLLLLGGCAEMDEMLQANVETVEFDCDDDRDIRVAFLDGGEEVRLFAGESSAELSLVDTRDGGDVRIYESRDGSVRMADDGEQIQVQVEGKENFEDCQSQDRAYRGGGGAF
jgi:hypothetical protein